MEKHIFNYRDIERLETDSVVGKLVEKKRLNNLVYVDKVPRQGTCTIYVRPLAPT